MSSSMSNKEVFPYCLFMCVVVVVFVVVVVVVN